MAASFRLAFAAILLASFAARADEPAKSRSLDPAKLPPNAVIIVSDKPADALQNVDAVVLTPDEYRNLLDAAERAKKLTTPDKPEPPSVCRLSGRVETRGSQEVAALRAEFQFRTTTPRATVLLGLQKGKPVRATIDDGRLAVLAPLKDDDGFAVQVDAAGEHRLEVDLEAPLSSRGSKGNERGIELGLPGAAITTIQRLAFPTGVGRVRVGGRTITAGHLADGTETVPAVLLGPVQKLDVTWDAPPSGQAEPQFLVDGRYDVRIEDHSYVTRARLTAKVQSGIVGTLELSAPPTAELTAEGPSPDSPARVQKPQAAGKPWVIRRDPSAADQPIDVTLKSALAANQPATVAAFSVRGAVQQRGTITIGGPPHLRLVFKPAADVARREAADDANRDAAFTFFHVPESGTLLTVEVQPVRGDVETQITQQFTLAERGWRWQGKFDVRPVRTEITSIELDLPAELQDLRPTSAELVEGITAVDRRDAGPTGSGNGTGVPPAGRKVVRVQLAEARRKPFTFTLEGLYPVAGTVNSASLPLVRPVGTLDRGGQISATAPTGLELRGTYREWEGDRPGEWDRPLDAAPRGAAGLAASVERSPARLDLAWRTPRADVPLAATVDLHLGERQAVVRHQWHVPAGPSAPRQFTVRGPATLAGRVRAVDGGSLTPVNPGEWTVQLTGPPGREAALTLSYSFPLPGGADRRAVAVPLVWLEPCPRCETDVRVYSTATPEGVLAPVGADGPWTEVPPRTVADRPVLPDLSLHGGGTQLPLTLRLAEAAAGPGTGLVVERLCVQAVVDVDGQQVYRTRCLVRPLQTHYLTVELPAPPASIQFVPLLDGKRLPWTVPDGSGGRFVRFRLDPADASRAATELDFVYTLPPAAGGTRWDLTLHPPRLHGPAFVGPVRWQIGVASGDLLVATGDDARFDWRWAWQRGLLAPRPAWSATDASRVSPVESMDGALFGWQPTAGPLSFLVVPRTSALLVGSLAVVGLGLIAVRVGPVVRTVGAGVLAVALGWLVVARPQAFVVLLYAAEPGAAVLVLFLLGRWAAQRRYRRRVLFLPTFTRTPSGGSGQARSPSGSRVRREPTTIDAPQVP